jgi:nicotinamidase/pyrazinamidase
VSRSALLLVDIQNDFCPGGALAVREGDAIIPVVNRLQPAFFEVLATQDWHPAAHGSFASQHPGCTPGERITLFDLPQILWPDHCVENTWGAEFHPGLETARIARVFRKGSNPHVDSYSGFYDNGRRHDTGLAAYLRERGIGALTVVGLATDYCVKWTALDAVAEGFETTVLEPACRGVELSPGDVSRALQALQAAGVRVLAEADAGLAEELIEQA